MAYHWDRMMRRPQDLGRLLDIIRDRRLEIATAHGSRDLQDPNDQFIAWVEVAHAQRSSTDTSRRLRRRFQAMREDGQVRGGPRWFGFPGADRSLPKDSDGHRPPVQAELVQRERDAIRAASQGIATGTMTLADIAAQWNAEGLRTATGGTWDGVNVRQVLSRPRNAGLINHEGAIVGRVRDEKPIVDEDTWNRVQAVFASRRRGRTPNPRNYIASGLIHCGQCGHVLTGRPRSRRRPDGTLVNEYYCHKLRGGCGRLAVEARNVETILRAFAIRRLSDARFATQIAAATAQANERAEEVAAELESARQVEDALAEKLGRGELSLSAWEGGHKHAHARVLALEAERDELAAQAAQAGPGVAVAGAEELAADWDADEATGGTLRRTMLAQALRGRRVVIEPRPHQNGKPVFDPTRVQIGLAE
ncbi:MAG: recombinase family protein [Pseudonocardiaceae bacterium]|nr:MAG: recombinase family protein [Pseudonocardiaceae bacterium]